MADTLFCFGYGYTASRLTQPLLDKGWAVTGVTRNSSKARQMKASGIAPIIWSDGELNTNALEGATHILISTPPHENGCPAFLAAAHEFANRADSIKWLGYLSSNGVYGDYGGDWVNEKSRLKGASERAKHRIKAESDWTALAEKSNLPLIVFRLPGIYGPGRSALDSVRSGKAKRVFKEGQVFSRMHVDDISAALAASFKQPRLHNLYNLADDEPAPPQDVIEYACKLLNVDPPPLIPFEDANLTDMAKSFYADNKRVSNALMKDALGVKLKHPTYREGLQQILADETAKASD